MLPDNRWDCGERINALDQLLNEAMNRMRQKIDERNRIALELADILAEKADWDLKTMQADLLFMKAEHEMIGKVGWGITKGIGWSLLATGISLFPGGAPVAWGIRGWRAYEAGKLVHDDWEVIKRVPDLPKVYELRRKAKALAEWWSNHWQGQINDLEAKVHQLDAEINGMRSRVDELWRAREEAYQDCLRRGQLPPGTWHRPAPQYSFDSEGNIIGVF